MTLKEILNQVLSECGFAESQDFFNSQNTDNKQLVALANRAARTLSKHTWQALRKTHTETLTTATSYALPTDFRQFIPDTLWAQGRADKPDFPASDDYWAYSEARAIDTSVRYKLRLEGDTLAVLSPVSGETVAYDYISDHPIQDADTSTKARFTKDGDTWLLDDDLIQMDLVWRFKKLKGLQDWQIDYQDFTNYHRKLLGTDKGSQGIYTVSSGERTFEPVANLWVS